LYVYNSQSDFIGMDRSEKLVSEIEKRRTSFKTESYSMSIGELANLYSDKEITIRPEYQRLFRWTNGQKIKLIESILLGIPIPSIFVYQDSSGMWELVDGLQRVSTILQFLGILDNTERLQLAGTKYLPSIDGHYWESQNDGEMEMPAAVKLSFKRAKLNFTIILSDSDPRAKFEVFQRLNTGGSNASNQEIRNNIMLMLKPSVYTWFSELAQNENFQNALSLSDRLYDEQYHMELLLRFIALVFFSYNSKKDLGDFLDDINEQMLTDDDFPSEKIKDVFEKIFLFLNSELGEKAFKKYDGSEYRGKFLESAFESITVGVGKNIDDYHFPDDNDILLTKIQRMYSEEGYYQNAGSGSNAKTRIPRLITFATQYYKKNG
jgi:uncharacterized protein with ParB-like and HNH nuclease domain